MPTPHLVLFMSNDAKQLGALKVEAPSPELALGQVAAEIEQSGESVQLVGAFTKVDLQRLLALLD